MPANTIISGDPIAAIVREPDGISGDAWLAEISRSPVLRTMNSIQGVNPFTRKPMEYHRPYAAHVSVNAQDVGSMVWEANRILIWGPLDQLTPIARDIANRMNAKLWFEADFPDQIDDE